MDPKRRKPEQPLAAQQYDYKLPENRIAIFPLPSRDESRLLQFKQGQVEDYGFRDLPVLLPENSVLIRNKTQVIPARLKFYTENGAAIEIFCLEPADSAVLPEMELTQRASSRWSALIGNAKRWPKTGALTLHSGDLMVSAHLESREQAVGIVRFDWQPESYIFAQVLEEAGSIPIPPYLKRAAEEIDQSRYQTHYAKEAGSVAAPTAGLHFTPEVDQLLEIKGIKTLELTLHVGAGTFRPIETDDVREHEMHGEVFAISRATLQALKDADGPRVAVGTTSMRTLESLYPLALRMEDKLKAGEPMLEIAQWDALELPEPTPEALSQALQILMDWLDSTNQDQLIARTQIMIAPGHKFALVDALITNFHQPKSTLLVLVDAWIGSAWRKVYAHALQNDYRFLSYGDSSLLWGRNSTKVSETSRT